METVLPWKARKLASAIKEKDNQIQALKFRNEEHQQKILRLNEEINELVAHRQVACRRCFENVLCFIKKNSGEVHSYHVIQCQYRKLEKHSDGLEFVTQTWRWLTNAMIQMPFTNAMIQMPFIDGTSLSVK